MFVVCAWFVVLLIVLVFMFVRTFEMPEKQSPKPKPVFHPRPKRVPSRAQKVREAKAWLDESLQLIDMSVTEPRANAAAKKDIYRTYLWKIKESLG